jgi:YHS domain-containing protein
MAKCPVCKGDVNEDAAKAQTGMTSGGAKEVDPTMATRQFHDGTWYYFDTLECRNKFTRNPDGYLQGSA